MSMRSVRSCEGRPANRARRPPVLAWVALMTFGVSPGARAQRTIPLPAEVSNPAEMRVKVAGAINPGWASDGGPSAEVTIDVWIDSAGRPDSVSRVWDTPKSGFGGVVAERAWRDGRFDPAKYSGWRRWTIEYTYDELKPTSDEKRTCTSPAATRTLLIQVLRWYEFMASRSLGATNDSVGGSGPPPLQLAVAPTFTRMPHCNHVLTTTLDSLNEYRSSRGSSLCVEGSCPPTEMKRERIEFRETELRWLPEAWTVRSSAWNWDLYCFMGECHAERWRYIS